MSATDIAAITTAVVTAVQLLKWGLPVVGGALALLAVALVSAVGVALWVLSTAAPMPSPWEIGVAWLTVMASAAGLYGFVAAPIRRAANHDEEMGA